MRFRNRTDAGKKLALALKHYRNQDGVVYALPRGGVVLGAEVAQALRLPLDLIIPRKVGHPMSPEYAICAVVESGEKVCNEWEVARVDPQWFQREVAAQQLEARRRRELYLKDRAPVPVAGRTAIIVDDGIATGLTMEAAIREARRRRPGRIVVAIPVVPGDTAARLRRQVDELVALDIPEYYLGAVGAYYDEFPQITDAEVIALLEQVPAAVAEKHENRRA